MYQSIYAIQALNINNDFKRYIVPQSVEIDLTNACNQDCTYCNVAEYRQNNKDNTKIHDYHKLIEQLSSWGNINSVGGVQTVTFVGGGEPTARKGYEYVLEQSVDSCFLTSIVTNGTFLDKLNNINTDAIKKIAWIGVDIDSGDENIYEQVRRSKSNGMFQKVKENIKWLTEINPRVDIKVLLLPETISESSLRLTFEYAKEVNARMLYFRLALMNDGTMFQPENYVYEQIKTLSERYKIEVKVNKSRLIERNYNRCHALYMLPIFSADGNVYLCCENRGLKQYSLCSWLTDDFRLHWNSGEHQKIYKGINAKLCKPCRPHIHNVQVQKELDNNSYNQNLFL